jgi:uncharacterized protein YjbJ (UPF0337 family)
VAFRSATSKAVVPSHRELLEGELWENIVMDKNRIAGAAKEAKGTLKDTIGKVTGDDDLQAEGKADKAIGKVQSAIGSMMVAVRAVLKM